MKVKVFVVTFTVCCFAASIIYFAIFTNYWWASIIVGMICVVVCTFLIRLPVVAVQSETEE